MKITRQKLRNIIQEEISILSESGHTAPCKVDEFEVTVLFDAGKAEIPTLYAPGAVPADIVCLMRQGMERDRNFITVKAGTSGTGSTRANKDVMLKRVNSALEEVAIFLDGYMGPTKLPYAIREIWNKADYDLNFNTIKPGEVIAGKYRAPNDPNDPWFKDKQYVTIKVKAPPVKPNILRLANRFLRATVDRLLPGTVEEEVYAVLKSLRDAEDFLEFNQALLKLGRTNFYQVSCSKGWDSLKFSFGVVPLTVVPGGPTEIDPEDTTIDAELRRLGVPPLRC
tara:strand:+ start:367 stop:1212 length:846 start_codon:yes stop_codon:yes gene_type:complete